MQTWRESESTRPNESGMKSLIDWARQQKRQGNLKPVFRVYAWWKQTERYIRVWCRRDAARVMYPLGVALHPNWENGHLTLGKALQLRYSYLGTRKSFDEKELVNIGNRAESQSRKARDLRGIFWLTVCYGENKGSVCCSSAI